MHQVFGRVIRTALVCATLGLVAIGGSGSAHAQDIFVKPSTDGASHGIGDLGMKPRLPEKKPAPAPEPPSQNNSGNPSPDQTKQAPAPVQPAPAPQPLPVVQPPPAVTAPQSGNSSGSMRTVNVGNVQVLQINTANDPIPKGEGNGALTLSFQPGLLGADDKRQIMNVLGLTEQEIGANCFFNYTAIIAHGQGKGDVIAVRGGRINYRFTPPLSSLDISPVVACRKLRAPISDTIEENGFYTVGLSTISCQPPTSASVRGQFAYLGNGKGNCAFN